MSTPSNTTKPDTSYSRYDYQISYYNGYKKGRMVERYTANIVTINFSFYGDGQLRNSVVRDVKNPLTGGNVGGKTFDSFESAQFWARNKIKNILQTEMELKSSGAALAKMVDGTPQTLAS
jgi:hypothetical protein